MVSWKQKYFSTSRSYLTFPQSARHSFYILYLDAFLFFIFHFFILSPTYNMFQSFHKAQGLQRIISFFLPLRMPILSLTHSHTHTSTERTREREISPLWHTWKRRMVEGEKNLHSRPASLLIFLFQHWPLSHVSPRQCMEPRNFSKGYKPLQDQILFVCCCDWQVSTISKYIPTEFPHL